MKAYAICFDNGIDKSKVFLNKSDAELCLKEIEKGKTYDRIPSIQEIEIKGMYEGFT